jgi:hypothetical protein
MLKTTSRLSARISCFQVDIQTLLAFPVLSGNSQYRTILVRAYLNITRAAMLSARITQHSAGDRSRYVSNNITITASSLLLQLPLDKSRYQCPVYVGSRLVVNESDLTCRYEVEVSIRFLQVGSTSIFLRYRKYPSDLLCN